MSGTNEHSIATLIAFPNKLTEAVEQERRAKSRAAWLGMTVMPRPDYQLMLQLNGGDVTRVAVDPRSAVYRQACVRTGDYVKPVRVINGPTVSVEQFNAHKLPSGVTVIIEFFRPGKGKRSGWLIGQARLTVKPRPQKMPKWKTAPQGSCGRRVQRQERPKFLNKMQRRSDVSAAMFRCLSLALHKYDNPQNEGFWPSYETWARDLGCKRRAAIILINRLRWIGVVRLVSGPTEYRRSNCYQITWPSNVAPPVAPSATWV